MTDKEAAELVVVVDAHGNRIMLERDPEAAEPAALSECLVCEGWGAYCDKHKPAEPAALDVEEVLTLIEQCRTDDRGRYLVGPKVIRSIRNGTARLQSPDHEE